MIKDYTLITLRNLRSRKVRSWLTMLGIFIGIAAVVRLISLGQGLEDAVTASISDLGTDKLVVTATDTGFAPPGSLAVNPLTEDDLKLVRNTPGVKLAVARMLRGVTIEYNEKRLQMFAVSMPESLEGIAVLENSADLQAEEGRLLKPGDKFKVVLGSDFLKEDNAFNKRIRIREKIEINGKNFDVVGIMKRISSPFGNDGLLIMEDTMRDLIDEQDEVDAIYTQIDPGREPKEVAAQIERVMRRQRDVDIGEEDFQVETPEQVAKTFSSILLIMQIIVIGIAGVSLFVGGIGIMNTMFTSVLERTKEIGILKAIGATNRNVLTFFMIESGFLGMAGGIVGVIMGILMSEGVEVVGKTVLGSELLKAQFPWYLIVGALTFSFFVGMASGVVPALQAARMHPVDALRKR
jgi:putative ABC transport system permease protein